MSAFQPMWLILTLAVVVFPLAFPYPSEIEELRYVCPPVVAGLPLLGFPRRIPRHGHILLCRKEPPPVHTILRLTPLLAFQRTRRNYIKNTSYEKFIIVLLVSIPAYNWMWNHHAAPRKASLRERKRFQSGRIVQKLHFAVIYIDMDNIIYVL
ncbi:hypothetical protein [Paenibacillus sp. FSL R7-277]|uniref:hypothetical protein n=1 Tax=Paenibacillus sp. FSL R7-277 TaxID=1227352 RepID=UPI001F191BEC|nr:hypothetical protein [Paenibacillus sp. FSL R7-277]